MIIDWCVAFNGGNVDVLSRSFFGSLFQHCNPVYTNRVKFHLIDNGGSRASVNLEYGPKNPVWYVLDKNWRPKKPPDEYYAESVLTPWDVAGYIVDKCGDHDWCIISHFDMFFKDDILARIIESMSSEVGIIGSHCPIMAVNREAYRSRSVGFAPGVGYDVGIALERDLKSKGWKHVPFNESMEKCFHHFGGGASHHNLAEFDHMRQRALKVNPDRWSRSYADLQSDYTEVSMDQLRHGITTLGGPTIIHLTYKPDGLSADWRIACMPNVTDFRTSAHQPNYLRSNDTRAVTCQECKTAPIFKKVQEKEH